MRIIAGSARGLRFDAPEGSETRPTLDRVKEAMFGMLQFDLPGSRVLDLFSGSGNLGLEAASRGAAQVICNDHDRTCAALIQRNADKLRLSEKVTVVCLDYVACVKNLAREGCIFDFVLIDAPYGDGTGTDAVKQVLEADLMNANGRILLEHATNLPPNVASERAELLKTKKFGACSFSVYTEKGKK